MDDALTNEMQHLLDERAIERQLAVYAHAVDGRDLERVRGCYWPEGTDEHDGFSGTRDEYCAWLAEVLPAITLSTHQFTNVLIDLPSGAAPPDTAHSDVLCLNAIVWRNETERHLLSCLRYEDDWENRHGEWRILRRRCSRVWTRVEDIHPFTD